MPSLSSLARGADCRLWPLAVVSAVGTLLVTGSADAQQAASAGAPAAAVARLATPVVGARTPSSPRGPAATTGRVEGILTDAATGEPLIGGQVAVRGYPLGNVSDDAGAYFINNIPAGAHVISVEYLGYEGQAKELEIEAGTSATLDFALQPTAIELEEIIVEEETVRDLSEYVEKTARPVLDTKPLREVEVARSDTSAMEAWHQEMRDLTVVHAIEYPLAGTTVYFRRPKPVKPRRPAAAAQAAAAADSAAARPPER